MHRGASEPDLEVEMGPGGATGRAGETDARSDAESLTHPNVHARQVRVHRPRDARAAAARTSAAAAIPATAAPALVPKRRLVKPARS
jgi:hypothetical protein